MPKMILLLVLTLLFSCESSTDNSAKKQTSKNTLSANSADKIKSANFIEGRWMPEEYLTKIESTRKVYDNDISQNSLFGFDLVKTNLLSDEPILNGYSTHQGGFNNVLVFNNEKKVFENDLSSTISYVHFEEPFEIRPIDKDHVKLYFNNSGKEEIYRRVNDHDEELRKILFEGNYVDTLSGQEVFFYKNGDVKGIKDFTFYSVIFDFAEAIDFDGIYLFKSEHNYDNSQTYHYKINADTVFLYPVTGEIPEYEFGELAYKLVKKHQ